MTLRYRTQRANASKRAFDLVVGTLAALLATPVIIVLAIAMAVSLRAWPFFVQRRVGRGGRHFAFPKIRTLPRSTPAYADKYEIAQLEVPRMALFLRRTHLDELPQLFLVPIGKMSLVGPRPEMPDLASTYPDWFREARTSVRPGCSGLWQVGDAAGGLIREAPQYDMFYLRHWGVRLDLWILWHSVRTLALRGQAVTLDDVPEWAQIEGADEVIDLRDPIVDEEQASRPLVGLDAVPGR